MKRVQFPTELKALIRSAQEEGRERRSLEEASLLLEEIVGASEIAGDYGRGHGQAWTSYEKIGARTLTIELTKESRPVREEREGKCASWRKANSPYVNCWVRGCIDPLIERLTAIEFDLGIEDVEPRHAASKVMQSLFHSMLKASGNKKRSEEQLKFLKSARLELGDDRFLLADYFQDVALFLRLKFPHRPIDQEVPTSLHEAREGGWVVSKALLGKTLLLDGKPWFKKIRPARGLPAPVVPAEKPGNHPLYDLGELLTALMRLSPEPLNLERLDVDFLVQVQRTRPFLALPASTCGGGPRYS